MMRKLTIWGMGIASLLLLFTSCLNQKEAGHYTNVFGIIVIEKGRTFVLTEVDRIGTVYSRELETSAKFEEGDCIRLSFSYDLEDKENKDYKKNRYIYVNLLEEPSLIPIRSAYASRTDTLLAWTDEIPMISSVVFKTDYSTVGLIGKSLFLTSAYEGGKNQSNSYSLYFDSGETPKKQSGLNVYSVYMRVQKKADGETPEGEHMQTNAYNIRDLLQVIGEKEQGNESFLINFKYMKTIDEETKEITWGSSEYIQFAVPSLSEW